MRRADAICAAYRSSVAGLPRPRTYTQIVAVVNKTLPLYEAALRRLEALRPPQEDESAVRAWLAYDRRIVAAERELGRAALRRDFPSVVAAASRVESAQRVAASAATTLGLKVCARP